MYLLDTSVVSEFRKTRPHGGVLAWLRSVDDRNLQLSAMTLGEIQSGIEITREQDRAKAAELEAWADSLAATWNIIPMDVAECREWAKLMHGRSDTLIGDAMIAATARVHGLQVVTRNVRDFKEFDVAILNPYMFR